MRLKDLEGRFVRHERRIEPWRQQQPDGTVKEVIGPVDYFITCSFSEAHGVHFVCPKAVSEGKYHMVNVYFDGSPVPPEIGVNKDGQTVRWHRSGTGLDDLTITPSIQEQDDICKWHGFVTNGDAK